MNKDLEDKYLSVIEDNVNVGKTNVGVEFFFLLIGIGLIILSVYFFSGQIANIIIDHMSNESQLKIEKLLSHSNIRHVETPSKKIEFLKEIKPKIVALDKNLQGKSSFPIYETDDKEINAYVMPDGKIYFTKGLLDKINSKQTLTFVLAHELGHYAHRDHLKSVGRELIAGVVLSVITFGQKDITSTVQGIASVGQITHSQHQEEQADLYANHVLYTLYGTNKGAVKFFEFLAKEEKVPEFLYYFSTHPSNSRRLYLIQNNR